MELLHATPLDGAPRALAAFRGRVLVGVGASLRLYEFGKKRLLRKCEHRRLPHAVARVCAQGSRVYVADAHDSFTFLKYKRADNAFYAFADDAVPRHLVAALALDYDTVAGADRFGSISVLRLPGELSAAVEEDPTAGKFADQAGLLGGAPNKLETLASFHVGEMVTALAKGALQAGGRELLLYATLLGGLGALLPFLSREDADFFQLLEMHMRQHAPSLVGRDHLAFRSAFYPVRCVVDGDLCEQFAALADDVQRQIAQELDRSPGEILKKLEDLRNKIV
ncbi:cleavage and polyadenylation specificity factor protein [Helicosporidium sp. ATCC 50920]|nr:cleavage and polyadenylation specificity factor protein [Helicosporidium sp. ATCC 50920]|eukprot:KDD74272.1 cleavage and polyadenylation specificity factor protein [Helicosporidium sp. ATCC 50920]